MKSVIVQAQYDNTDNSVVLFLLSKVFSVRPLHAVILFKSEICKHLKPQFRLCVGMDIRHKERIRIDDNCVRR
jgi:hypothetical protein